MEPITPPNAPLQLSESTPIKVNCSTMLPFTTTAKYCYESYTMMADEIKKYIVGPMPMDQFLKEFLPKEDISDYSTRREFHAGCYDDTMQASTELQAYDPFVSPSKVFCSIFSHNYGYF
jgi:hypothetical protein